MKFASIVISIIVTIALSCAGDKPLPTEIEFQKDFEAASKLAGETGQHMIVDFYTDWCKSCKELDSVTFTDPIVIGLSADNIFVKINAEIDSLLADQYNISGYPTIVLIDSKGSEIDRIWGYLEPTEFFNQVQLYLQGKETLDDYLNRLKDEENNLEYLSKVGEKYSSRSNTEEAMKYYSKIIELDADNSAGYAAKAMSSIHNSKARTKDLEGAIETCSELIEKFPGTEQADEAAAVMGYYTERMDDKAGAVKLYKAYLDAYPNGENVEWITNRIENIEGK